MSELQDFVIENGVLTKYTGSGGDVITPEGILKIGKRCGRISTLQPFARWDRPDDLITSITITEGVKIIADHAFYSSHGVKHITLPSTVESIGDRVFWACRELEDVTFLSHEISCGTNCFDECTSLKEIIAPFLPISTFPESDAKKLMLLGFLGHREMYDDAQAAMYRKYLFSQKRRLLPELLRKDCLEAVKLFAENGKITVENVQKDFVQPAAEANSTQCLAFLNDWKGKNISDGQEQAASPQGDLSAAELIELWRKSGDQNAPAPKPEIEKRNIKNNLAETADLPIRNGVLGKYNGFGGDIVIPGSVKKISASAFYNCKGLTSIVIPGSVTEIGDKAFNGCEKLAEITIEQGLDSMRPPKILCNRQSATV